MLSLTQPFSFYLICTSICIMTAPPGTRHVMSGVHGFGLKRLGCISIPLRLVLCWCGPTSWSLQLDNFLLKVLYSV
jgi:hypothetical protein